MDYAQWFSERLTQLRMEKGVSARDMSLSLGQSESYINKIENKRTMPSMTGFFYICEYLKISPSAFFDSDNEDPAQLQALTTDLKKLNAKDQEAIHHIIKCMIQ